MKEAGAKATRAFPSAIFQLGLSRDDRAIPILRQALHSPNFLVAHEASEVLADLIGKAAIPAIIDACNAAPPAAAVVIAMPLRRFDDPVARDAIKRFTPAPRQQSDSATPPSP